MRSRMILAASCSAIVLTVGMDAWPQSPALRIILAGQSLIRTDMRVYAPSAMPAIAPLLQGDVAFTDFEATVLDKSQSLQPGKILSPPETLEVLKDLGFNLLALSNNHAFDLKVSGIQNTLREVSRLNLAHAGTGNTMEEAAAPAYLRTPKGTVALVAMASGLIESGGSATATRPGVNELRVEGGKPNEEDAQRILQSIRDASKRADLVIAYHHNHVFDKPFATLFEEELAERLVPPDWIKKWTHAEVDAGADIVVMHGAPLVHGVEIYRNRPIFYDLGNFIYQVPAAPTGFGEATTWESVVASVEFQKKNLQSIRFRPIVMNKFGQGQVDIREERTNDIYNAFFQTRGLPTPATGERAGYILERLAESSRPFGTKVEVRGDTAEINLKGGN